MISSLKQTPVNSENPLETLLKGMKPCSCSRTHTCRMRLFSVADSGAEALLGPILKKLKIKRVHIISDEPSMLILGDRVASLVGSLGYAVGISSFPSSANLICNHEFAGNLLLHIPQSADVLIAVGDRTVCDLAKFVALKNDKPVILLPTAACTDSFTCGSAEFLENSHRVRLPAAVPHAILADLDVMSRASIDKNNAGVAAVFATYVSLADWKLSCNLSGSYTCSALGDTLLSLCDDVLAVLRQGRSVSSLQLLRPLITCLVGAGAISELLGSDAPIRGSESAMAYYLEQKLVAEDITDYSFDVLRGIGCLYAVRMYEALRGSKPDFAAADHLYDSYGWQYYNSEMLRVFGEQFAHTLLSRQAGSDLASPEQHKIRMRILSADCDKILADSCSILPPYSMLLSRMRALQLPCSLADLQFTKEEALDAIVWSREMTSRYGIFRLLADLGELEIAADRFTENMPSAESVL